MNVLKGTSGIVLDSDGKALVNGNGTVALPDGVGVVDLGTFTWARNTTSISGKYRFRITIADMETSGVNCVCSHYNKVSSTSTGTETGFAVSSNVFFIFDDNLATLTAEEFQSAMNGVLLFYKKST